MRLIRFVPVVAILSIGFLLFEPWLVVVQLLLGVTVWGFIDWEQGVDKTRDRSKGWGLAPYLLWALLALFVVTRLYPFWFGGHPLGYDTGIYRYEIWSSVQALPEYVSGLFLGLPLLTDVGSVLGFSVDQLLYGSLFLFALLALLGVVIYTQGRHGERAGVLVALLFVVSLVQWQAFEMVLLKQLLALGLLFVSCWLVERRSFWFLPLLLFLGLLQPLDALLLGLSVVIYGLWQWFRDEASRPFFVWLLLLSVLLGLLTLLLEPAFWLQAWDVFVTSLFTPEQAEASLQEGIFLSLSDYGYQSAFLFVFGMLGWMLELKRGRVSMLSGYLVLVLLWIVLRLFFFQRLLIQLDAVLMVYSAVALLAFFRVFVADRMGKAMMVILLLGLALPFGYRLQQFEPDLDDQAFAEIEAFCAQVEPEATIVATDSYYAPWVRGACLGHLVFGPGVFANQWSREDWEAFWTGDVERVPALLEQYALPMYFYVGEQQKTPAFAEAFFEQVDERWWKAI